MTYRIANLTIVTAGTGIISSTGTTVTGIGTDFLTQLIAGDILHDTASGQVVVVATIAGDDSLTVATSPVVPFAGGTFIITKMLDVSTLVVDAVAPLGIYNRWLETKTMGSGLNRALGRPKASWLFKNPSVLLRAALLAHCPGKSALVYICTLTDPSTNTFATFLAGMDWPDNDDTYNQDFVIDFKGLVSL